MRVKVTLAGYYDLSDSPAERQRIYGTSDVEECLRIDRTNDPDLLLDFCEEVTIESSSVS